jgi:very-short-patch-repair endonuclease
MIVAINSGLQYNTVSPPSLAGGGRGREPLDPGNNNHGRAARHLFATEPDIGGTAPLAAAPRKRSIPLRFRRQYPIGRFVVDFVCLSTRLIIEVDGETHDHTIEADARRTQWLEAQGFRLLRFMNSDVLKNTEGVVQAIQIELARTPPPTPSRKGRG